MRIYSNTLLSCPQTLHVFQAARIYPGRWLNYYFYKVERVQPLVLTTYSPIDFLQENCQYYCYNKYYRDESYEKYGNRFEMVSVANQETWVHIPKNAGATDIIVVRNDRVSGYPINWFRPAALLPVPVLQ